MLGSDEKHYTYTIITTDSNKQLKFLHDRMPVILGQGSDQIRTWLDPQRYEWSKDLQSLLKPFEGELECYPVSKDVGKVGNNSPTFIIPVASSENKNNIANFFTSSKPATPVRKGHDIKKEEADCQKSDMEPTDSPRDDRITVDKPRTEDNAPMPIAVPDSKPATVKRDREDGDEGAADAPAKKAPRSKAPVTKQDSHPVKSADKAQSGRKTRSATSNGTTVKSRASKGSDGSQRITNFFSTYGA